METTAVEDFRKIMTSRFASCLMGEIERGAKVARYQADRIAAGINLIVDCDLDALSKQVEYALNALVAERHRQGALPNYRVTLNTVNCRLYFAAYIHHV